LLLEEGDAGIVDDRAIVSGAARASDVEEEP
jgi:hypothetical protein